MKKNKFNEEDRALDNFFKEVSEDVQNDRLKKIWDTYGLHIIIAIIIVLTIAVSFETLKAWRVKRNETWSDAYAYALNLQNQGKYEESLKVLADIAQKNKGIYSDIAEIQKANILFEQGKNAEALALLENIVQNEDINPKMRHITAVKLATYKLDTAPRDEIEKLLTPLMQEESSWKNIAKEMLAMLEIREGNIEKAKTIYEEILNSPDLSDGLKLRVQDMLSALTSIDK